MKKGIFITFEGIEGCGKSTQTKLLEEYLNNNEYKYIVTREPGGTLISEKIRQILLDVEHGEMNAETELLLYMASRSQHTGEKILPALTSGKIVICDRYYDSTIAYQGAARDLDRDFITSLTDFATFSTEPDITFLLDITVAESFERISGRGKDRLELESSEFHNKVRNEFLNLATRFKKRYYILDGKLTKEEIFSQIINIINNKLEGKNEFK